MPINTARLSKIIKIAYASDKDSRKEINDDVATTIRKENASDAKANGPSGDFHSVIWAAFKGYIFEENPIESFSDLVKEMIEGSERRKGNKGRRRLYPLLGQGLINWGTKKRRWMNEDIKRIKAPTGSITVRGLEVEFSVNNLLALEIVGKGHRYIYPYFPEEPALTEEAARVALWQMHKALPFLKSEELRILDVIRGESFSILEHPLHGNEQELFEANVKSIIQRWDKRYQEKSNPT